jgi:hypothetical protein
MITSRKLAAVVFAGGATLVWLAGCAQAPSTYRQPWSYYDPRLDNARIQRAYIDWAAAQIQRAYLAQLNAWRQQQQQLQAQSDDAPVTEAVSSRPKRVHRAPADDDGQAISDNPPTPQKPGRPECSGFWRLCHFL